MRMRHLLGLVGVFGCLSFSVNAQYTTKSDSAAASGFTTKKPAAAPTAARPTTANVPAATAPTAAAPTAQPAPGARPNVYRPRPKPVEDTGEEDLPSFSAFDQGSQQAQPGAAFGRRPAAGGVSGGGVAAQGSNEGAVPGEPVREIKKPTGEVWVYSTDFKMDKVGRFPFCSFKRVLQNRTDATIERLSIEFSWPGYTTEKVFTNIEPKGSDVMGMTLYLETCPALNTKPKIKIKTCRIGEVYGEECEKLIVVK